MTGCKHPDLTDKQRLFVEEYLVCWNATEAAQRAGYTGSRSTLASIGYENLRKPEIQAAIQQRFADKAMASDEVLGRLADIARGSMENFLSWSGRGVRLDLSKAKKAEQLHLLKSFSKGKAGTKIEIHDPLRALELIGKHLGLFKEQHEGQVSLVEMTLEQWQAQQTERREQAEDTLGLFGEEENE